MFDHLKTFLIERWLNPPWRSLYILGHHPIIGASATALIVVPLYSRLLVSLKTWLGSSDVKVLNQAVSYFDLPKVMLALWSAALFALIGKLVYEKWCPVYIKYGHEFTYFRHMYPRALPILVKEFYSLWNMSAEIQTQMKQIVCSAAGANNLSVATDWNGLFSSDSVVAFEFLQGPLSTGKLEHLLRQPHLGEAIFAVVRRMRDEKNPLARFCCATCYYTSIIIIGCVFIVQLQWVFRAI